MKVEQEVYMGNSKHNFSAGEENESVGKRIGTVADRQHDSVEKDRKEDEKDNHK